MQFGEVAKNQLNRINFSLPSDPKGNAAVLAKGKRKAQVFHGCAKWGRPEWVGKIYPIGASEKDFLHYYGQHYDSIELNATHYRIHPKYILKEWKKKVDNPDFRFCPKAPRGMSFLKETKARNASTEAFMENITTFGQNLGPVFITHDEQIKWDAQAETEFFFF